MNNILTIYVFNTGAGDNLLIEFPNSEFGIIDLNFDGSLNQSEPPALTFLKKLPVDRQINIAFLCISHYDNDHIKGIEQFLHFIKDKRVKVKDVWLAGTKDKSYYKDLFQKRLNKKVLTSNQRKELADRQLLFEFTDFNICTKMLFNYVSELNSTNVLYLYDIKEVDVEVVEGISCFSIAPLMDHIEKFHEFNFNILIDCLISTTEKISRSDNNLISSIFFLKHSAFQWAFGGDSPRKVWEESIALNNRRYKRKLHSDFIKVSHHGSEGSTSSTIWENLINNPRNPVLGITAGELYRHPRSKTITDIKDRCRDCKLDYYILPTNVCSECSKVNAIHPENIDILEPLDDKILSQYGDNFVSTNHLTGPGLLAYKIEYNLDNKHTKLTRQLDKTIFNDNLPCRYNNTCIVENGL